MSRCNHHYHDATLATASQLGLSFETDVLHTWKDMAHAPTGTTALIFSVTLTRDGAKLVLQGPWPQRDASAYADPDQLTVLWEADVQMRNLARAQISASPHGSQQTSSDGLPINLVAAPLGWATEAVDALPTLDGASFLAAMGRSLEQVVRHLRACAVTLAANSARAFPRRDGAQWFVYAAAANDPSGRLARLAIRCPGVLILCKGLVDHGATSVANDIMAEAARGVRLARLIRMACVAWAEVQRARHPLLGLSNPGQLRISPDQLALQQRRVRAASSQVAPRMLWSVPAVLVHDRNAVALEPAAAVA